MLCSPLLTGALVIHAEQLLHVCFCLLLPPAVADQSAGDGEDEGGAREEEILPSTRSPQGKGKALFIALLRTGSVLCK